MNYSGRLNPTHAFINQETRVLNYKGETTDTAVVSVDDENRVISVDVQPGAIVVDYKKLLNKPKINGTVLYGDKSSIDFNLYTKPSDGIPKAHLTASIQASLDKADTALQSIDLVPVYSSISALSSHVDDVEATLSTRISNLSAFVVSTYRPSADQDIIDAELNSKISAVSSDLSDKYAELSSGISALEVATSSAISALSLDLSNKYTELSSGISSVNADLSAKYIELSSGIASVNSSLSAKYTELSAGISSVSSDLSAKYVELTTSISNLSEFVVTTYRTKEDQDTIDNNIKNSVSSLSAHVSAVESSLAQSISDTSAQLKTYTDTSIASLSSYVDTNVSSLCTKIDTNVSSLSSAISVVATSVAQTSARAEEINTNLISSIASTSSALQTQINTLESAKATNIRVDALETAVYSKISETSSTLSSKIDNVNSTLSTKIDNVNSALSTRIDTLDSTKINLTEKGAASGVAELDENGHVPVAQLPSYVDDIIEGYYYDGKFYEDEEHTIQIIPETNKIYVDLHTNRIYRWGGTVYVEISSSLALGETETTAYRGDRGKIAYDHSQIISGNPHGLTTADLSLENVDNTADMDKPISYAVQTALAGKQANLSAGSHIAISTDNVISATYTAATTTSDGLLSASDKVNYDSAYSHSIISSGNPHNVTKSEIGLGNVDNTSDADKPISTATEAALSQKASAVHTHTKSDITDFPTSMPASDVYEWAKQSTKPAYTYTEVGAASDSHTHNASQITGLATVATTGSYSDLTNKPSIPTKVSELSNDAGYTTNTGTVTSVAVKMNDAVKGTITTSGTIDLGTVLTEHQDISGKEDVANKVQTIDASATSDQYPSAKAIYDSLTTATTIDVYTQAEADAKFITTHQDISGKQDKSNLVTSLTSSSTDTQYPSAKCVYDLVGNVETLLTALL